MRFLPGQLVATKYRLLQRLGHGALGEVWAARNETIDREVAIKFITPKRPLGRAELIAFFQDAKASGKIRHPSVVELLDLGEADPAVGVTGPWVVMELLEADKLDDVLDRCESLPIGTSLRIAAELAGAVAAAHTQNVPHLQIEPANVLLHRDVRGVVIPKLVDFGISRLGASTADVAYLSPEQARDESPIDDRADVWALGVLLHHCLIGAPPFRARTRAELLAKIAGERVAPNVVDPSIDAKVSNLVMDCLVEKRQLRPTARAFAHRAEELLARLDDHFRDLAAVLEIPADRTLAHLAALRPGPRSPDARSTPPPATEATRRMGSVALPPPPPRLDVVEDQEEERDAPPLSSSNLEDAPSSRRLLDGVGGEDEDAIPVSSSNLEEIPLSRKRAPFPAPMAIPLVTRSIPPRASKAPPSTTTTMTTTTSTPPIAEAPVGQLIADRLGTTKSGSDTSQVLADLEEELLGRLAAARASHPTPSAPPLPAPPMAKEPSTPKTPTPIASPPVVVAPIASNAQLPRDPRVAGGPVAAPSARRGAWVIAVVAIVAIVAAIAMPRGEADTRVAPASAAPPLTPVPMPK